jgi:hypothetical protein
MLSPKHPKMFFQALDDLDQNVFAHLIGAVEPVNTCPAARGCLGQQISYSAKDLFVCDKSLGQ